jgi:hypothetical protein
MEEGMGRGDEVEWEKGWDGRGLAMKTGAI